MNWLPVVFSVASVLVGQSTAILYCGVHSWLVRSDLKRAPRTFSRLQTVGPGQRSGIQINST